jgi:hypothetical protein
VFFEEQGQSAFVAKLSLTGADQFYLHSLLQPASCDSHVTGLHRSQEEIRQGSINLSKRPFPSTFSSDSAPLPPSALPQMPQATSASPPLPSEPSLPSSCTPRLSHLVKQVSSRSLTPSASSIMRFSDWEYIDQENTLLGPDSRNKLSALSLLRPDLESPSRGSQTPTQGSEDLMQHQRAHSEDSCEGSEHSTALTTPTLAPNSPATGKFPNRSGGEDGSTDGDSEGHVDALSGLPTFSRRHTEAENSSERSPLLRKASSAPYMTSSGEPGFQPSHFHRSIKSIKGKFSQPLSMFSLRGVGKSALRAIPAVLLGCLLNILDGVSCAFHHQACHIATE